MINKNIVIPIIIFIFIIVVAIVLLIGIYHFNWFNRPENSYTKFASQIKFGKLDFTDVTEDITQLIDKEDIDKENEDIIEDDDRRDKKVSYEFKKKETIKKVNSKYLSVKTRGQTRFSSSYSSPKYSKGSNLPDQSFNSLGEYISEEEKQYRITLIKNLIIKTIVIDNLTKGNGISQEFFKVAYIEKMIPAKILEQIVESKEFRNLMPKKYLKKEIKTKGLAKGETVKFKSNDIKDILILWSLGRLTPIQKAWVVKAEE
ncbi:MAG: hypothetical protein KAT05_13685 [Spirochaetes bacterium]|nr:hypothetical protein [Spirochaetota bacterium]